MEGGEKKAINQALWLECAGPLITLPAIGSQVVYFPQGHSEQVIASTQKEGDAEIPSYPNLPPQLFCLLHNITLHADQENDEVFAQMTLQPLQQTTLLKDPFLLPDLGIQPKQVIVSFSKTLTASDTSTHGGFSIPRRAAEKVFPALDFNKTPPAQELVARDLHNNEWHFRHIYRGQPRRHLLTTGWSVFVSAKRLQAGDTVLFIRDEQGHLMLGIRRANRQQSNLPTSLLSSDSMLIGVLAAAAHAASTGSRFTIFYNPRASPSEFVIPLAKYQKAFHPPQVTVGMRFRMEMETEDSSTRRYMGTITGIGDLDAVRWPNSHWRSLKVGWDESTAGQRQRRVSAWEIEPLTAPFLLCNSSFLLRSKRLRPNDDEMDMKAWGRADAMQGMNFPGIGMDHWLRVQQQQQQQQQQKSGPVQPPVIPPVLPTGYYSSILQDMKTVNDTSKQLMQNQFQQLQQFGQAIPPLLPPQQQQQQHHPQMHLPTISEPPPQLQQPPQIAYMPPTPTPAPPAAAAALKASSETVPSRSASFSALQNVLNRPESLMMEENVSYTSMLQQGSGAMSPPKQPQQHQQQQQQPQQQGGMMSCLEQPPGSWMPMQQLLEASQVLSNNQPAMNLTSQVLFRDSDQEGDPRSHVLFGVNIDGSSFPSPAFSSKGKDHLSGLAPGASSPREAASQDIQPLDDLQQSWPQQVYPPPIRTFTKVHKVGSVGRSLDMTRFKNYNELRTELARMFGLDLDSKSSWQVVFIDNENDLLLLGDDPWEEFIGCVKSIRILSSSEVMQMSQEMEWLTSMPLQHKQASSSSDEHPPRQNPQEGSAEAILPTTSGGVHVPPAPAPGVVPRTLSNYSDPSCISDGI